LISFSYPGDTAKEAGTMTKKLILVLVLMAAFLGACSNADGPEQIATFPREEPIAVYPRILENMVVYNATLDLEVSDVERVTERAKEIAFEQNGYLVSAQSWYRDGERHSTVVLAIPVLRFNHTRDDLLRLGTLNGEWISTELVSIENRKPDAYSQITLYLHPRESCFSEISLPKLRPVRTFEKAWAVLTTIFGFLLDILIWITVVAGPFILIGWVLKKSIQWWQRTSSKK
jgi:hypothetical protein